MIIRRRPGELNSCMLSSCRLALPTNTSMRCPRSKWLMRTVMDDVENNIDKRSAPISPSAERVLVRIIAELEEVAKGSLPKDQFITDIIKIAENLPLEMMQKIAITLLQYYLSLPPGKSYVSLDLRNKMGEYLLNLIPEFPENLKKLFQVNWNLRI